MESATTNLLLDFNVEEGRKRSGFFYLGTPYTLYPGGIDKAFIEACVCAAWLFKQGVCVYCPIAHTHPIAIHGAINPLNVDLWLGFDREMMDASVGMIVAKMNTWQNSYGVRHEIAWFREHGKPVYGLDWPRSE